MARIVLKELEKKTVLFKASTEKAIVGLDVAYRRLSGTEYAYGVALLYDAAKKSAVDCMVATRAVCVPYIPGLLAFREMAVLGPLAVKAIEKWRPSVFFVDGHGLSHPRRIGIATHVGFATRTPSIGVAKKKLVGVIRNGYVVVDGEPLAAVIRTPTGSTIYVSPGYGVTLEDARRTVLKYLKHKLPEPLRLADAISKASKKLVEPSRDFKIHPCPRLLEVGA
ncbi:MAG: endonuclease V [Desulfurococcales archaeon]|nr:endonuclease V [Desulfurococcales archaeon]